MKRDLARCRKLIEWIESGGEIFNSDKSNANDEAAVVRVAKFNALDPLVGRELPASAAYVPMIRIAHPRPTHTRAVLTGKKTKRKVAYINHRRQKSKAASSQIIICKQSFSIQSCASPPRETVPSISDLDWSDSLLRSVSQSATFVHAGHDLSG
jgi:hypothetical protein